MKIEVGEYVRLKNGLIGQFYNIEEGYDGNTEVNFEEFGYEYEDIEQFYEDIKVHSKIISEIVEVGDYVNGYKVISIDYDVIDDKTECIELDLNNNYQYNFISARQIKTILTKEQFSSIEYKVEEEK